MIIRNRIDLALISTGPDEVVDIGEKGFERADLYIEKQSGGTVTIQGSDTEDGDYSYTETITVPAEGFYRGRIPMDMPQYIRLSATGAKLSVRA